ncbi:MAG: tRNA uridine-5-carboxymethylaminomethyl(34) synthesis GTPase MnmE [Sphingorhabdus sp.]
MADYDTIFALSSGAPPAAIAIIRISGARSFAAVEAIAGRVPKPRKPSLAKLRSPDDGGLLDEALLLIFPGPDSATGEDLAELHLHGGRAVIRAVEGVLAGMDGLRQAEAGEFTRRAFLNGRIDLNEADALGDLLSAESEWQRRAAATMIGGKFAAAIERWREEVLRVSAAVEAVLDFSDEDDVESSNNINISNTCGVVISEINGLLDQPPAEKLRDGLRVVLGGPPNSGKSTLLNALVAREAAIVSDIAGTTRDVIEVPVALQGLPLVFIDTAGVGSSGGGDVIEAIGIKRAHNAFAGADMILWLGPEGEGPEHDCLLEVDAKIDEAGHVAKSTGMPVSAKTDEGMSELAENIVMRSKMLLPPPDSFAVNRRQRAALKKTANELQDAAVAEDMLIAAEQLRQARLALDALTGRAHTEDMLDTLFGRFCIGK